MNSTLKILVPVVLLIGGIFALTYISQSTPREAEDKKASEVVSAKKPLQFFSSTRRWVPREMYDESVAAGDPPPGSLQDTEFAGFYEPGETQNIASFWFANRSPAAVRVQLKAVSCNTCSGGKLAALPADVTKQLLQMTAISALPQGLVSGLPLGLAAPAAQLDSGRDVLKWTYHPFLHVADAVYELPGAPSNDPWAEQWAIMDLLFKAKAGGELNTLSALFATSAQGEEAAFDEKLDINYVSSPPFELDKAAIEVGELTDASAVQQHELLIYSSTRTPAQVGKLNISVTMPTGVSGEPGAFVSAGEPVLIPESEYLGMMRTISFAKKKPTRIKSAYRMAITVATKVGDAKLDIGRVERNVNVSLGSDSLPVRVAGSMRGPIYLSNAKDIGFGNFSYSNEQIVTVTVETDRAGVDLRIVPELTQPKGLKLDLQKQPDIGDRGIYKLKATLPAKEQLGEIRDGVVVLEAKGPNPLRLRIPVTGRGR